MLVIVGVAIIYIAAAILKTWSPVTGSWKLTIESGAIILRTSKLNRFIEETGRKGQWVIKALATVSIPVSIYLMVIGTYFIHDNLVKMMVKSPEASPFIPVVPGVTLSLGELPYFLVAICVVLLSHELAHGFVAAAEGIPISSSALFLFLVFPGGFIEPDEEGFLRSSLISKIRVLVAGTAINYALAMLFSFLLSVALVQAPGVLIEGVLKGYPAYEKLKPLDIIVSINSTPINTLEDLNKFMRSTKPGDVVVLEVLRQGRRTQVKMLLDAAPGNSSRGFMGTRLYQCVKLKLNVLSLPYYDNVIMAYRFNKLLLWIIIACSSIAVINMLPIYPFDGGQILGFVILRLIKNEYKARLLRGLISIYFIIILVANIVFTFSIPGVKVWLP